MNITSLGATVITGALIIGGCGLLDESYDTPEKVAEALDCGELERIQAPLESQATGAGKCDIDGIQMVIYTYQSTEAAWSDTATDPAEDAVFSKEHPFRVVFPVDVSQAGMLAWAEVIHEATS